MKYFYAVLEIDPDLNDRYGPVAQHFGEESTAEVAAEHFHDAHDGWECSWPLTFVLFNAREEEEFRAVVEREYSPVFSARKVV